MQKERVKDIRNFLIKGTFPPKVRKSAEKCRNFKRGCEKFILKDNTLFYRHDGKPLRVVKEKEKEAVLKSVHASTHGGHLGVNRT